MPLVALALLSFLAPAPQSPGDHQALPPARGLHPARQPQGSFDVAALVHALAPDFVITLGDNNYPNGAAGTIDQNVGQHYHDYIWPYTGGYGAGAAVNRFFPSLGNHDWIPVGALPYLNYFQLPLNERY